MTVYLSSFVIFPDATETLPRFGYISLYPCISGTVEVLADSPEEAEEKIIDIINKMKPEYMEWQMTDIKEKIEEEVPR